MGQSIQPPSQHDQIPIENNRTPVVSIKELTGLKSELESKLTSFKSDIFTFVSGLFTRYMVGLVLQNAVVYYLSNQKNDKDTDPQLLSDVRERLKEINRDPNIASKLNEHEKKILSNCVYVPKAGKETTMDDIGGMKTEKDTIMKEFVNKLTDPVIQNHLKKGNNISQMMKPPKGMLLYGPPGCGKTMLAKATAVAVKAVFIQLKESDLKSKWVGDSVRNAAAVFTLARKLKPAILFFDECESLFGKRIDVCFGSNSVNEMKSVFLQEWDGFNSSNNPQGSKELFDVIVIGATNQQHFLDKAFKRRFPAKVYVGKPDEAARIEIFKNILAKETLHQRQNFNESVYRELADKADSKSGRAISEICRRAISRSTDAKEMTTDGLSFKLKKDHFDKTFDQMEIEKKNQFEDNLKDSPLPKQRKSQAGRGPQQLRARNWETKGDSD